jgi:PPK2 family polyphosphate:nucleotide phosphotransferase
MKKLAISQFKVDKPNKFKIKNTPTEVDDLYESKGEYESLLKERVERINELQNMMYAHNQYGLLLIFQAMDAAGKDGTINHVFAGVNPFGLKISSFKRPTETELDHDFMWRNHQAMPERGMIGIFNRSYYEEVLVVKVHPEILKTGQRIPAEYIENLEKVWQQRYADMLNYERYISNNGIKVVKFFLHISKKEQSERLIERIEDETKNWKFDEADVKERNFWEQYQSAFEDLINATAADFAPWYVVPADDKKNMRLIVAEAVIEVLESMNMNYPPADATRKAELMKLIEVIKKQDEA